MADRVFIVIAIGFVGLCLSAIATTRLGWSLRWWLLFGPLWLFVVILVAGLWALADNWANSLKNASIGAAICLWYMLFYVKGREMKAKMALQSAKDEPRPNGPDAGGRPEP